jgi:hypothetical protein
MDMHENQNCAIYEFETHACSRLGYCILEIDIIRVRTFTSDEGHAVADIVKTRIFISPICCRCRPKIDKKMASDSHL